MPSKALVLGVSALALLLACVLVASALVAVPVPLSQDRLNRYLHHRYPLHDIRFARPTVTWSPVDWVVELDLRDVTLHDAARDVVASVPRVVLAIDPASLLTGDARLRSLLVSRPVLRVERSAGGALKLDIGQGGDGPSGYGRSGSVMTMLLTDMVAAGAGPARLPEISMRDARLALADEISGARFAFDVPQATLRATAEGARLNATLAAVTSGETIELDLEGFFRSRDRTIRLRGAFGNVNPAILAELLPGLPFLAPIEIPLSGRFHARFGQGAELRAARFDVEGQAGSLEIAQYTGRNIAVDRLRATATYRRDRNQLDLRPVLLDFEDKRLTGALQSVATRTGAHLLRGDLTLAGWSWDALLPLWFGGLGRVSGEAPAAPPAARRRKACRWSHASTARSTGWQGMGSCRCPTSHPAPARCAGWGSPWPAHWRNPNSCCSDPEVRPRVQIPGVRSWGLTLGLGARRWGQAGPARRVTCR